MRMQDQKVRQVRYEFIRFLLVGFTTVFIDLLFYVMFLNFFDLNSLLSKLFSFLIGTVFAYFANRSFTFKYNNRGPSIFLNFVALYIFSLFFNVGINEIILNTYNSYFLIYPIAFIIASAASALLNYFSMKYIVFSSGKKKWFFSKTFFPKHKSNRMQNEGNLAESRRRFLSKRFNNLDFLLRKRYEWMNQYLKPKMKIIEIGCGSGLSKLFLSENVLLTDASNNPWVDKVIDGTNMDLKDSSIDVIIASHTIHHFYNPAKFFKECSRVLKEDGVILISEINTSLIMRMILKLMRHEGYSYEVDVFNYESICNDKNDLWSANCAIPELLFDDESKFNNFFPELKICYQNKTEFFIFPLSGGVVAKKNIIEIPSLIMKFFDFIDKFLIYFLPSIFALGRNVVIKKSEYI